MSKKVLSRIISGLLVGASLVMFALLMVPLMYAYSRHGEGPYQFNCLATLKSTAPVFDWYGMNPGDKYHFVKVVLEAVTILSLVLIAGGIGVGIASLVKPEHKVLHKVMLALFITITVVSFLLFGLSVADALVTSNFGNKVTLYTPYPYAVLLAACVVAFVFMGKYKKAE